MVKTRNLFISHSWTYSEHYDKVREFLADAPRFDFVNLSVPKDDPIHTTGSYEELRYEINQKIIPSHIVLVIAGVYASYSKWIDIEIELAKNSGKPILAIEYWGSERTSQVVKNAADKIVKWNTNSIVQGIRELVP